MNPPLQHSFRNTLQLAMAVLLLLALLPAAHPARPAYAAALSAGSFAELETAISNANASAADDTITLTADIALSSALPQLADRATGGSLTIDGNAYSIDGAGSYQIFSINSGADVSIKNLTLKNGKAGNGGAINNAGRLTISASSLSDNYAYDAGGAIYNRGTLTLSSNSTLSGNRANSSDGGAIYNYTGTVTVSNSTLSSNQTAYNGGAIGTYEGTVTISNSTLSSNEATESGGAVAIARGTVTVSDSTISGNQAAYYGGAIYNTDTLTVTNSSFSSNRITYSGGGIYAASNSSTTLTGVTFSQNEAGSGGGMYIYESSPSLTDVRFSKNKARNGPGGGMFVEVNSSPHLIRVEFTGNQAHGGGGGMANYIGSASILSNVIFSGNQVTDGKGGGMYNYDSSPLLVNVSFASNQASVSGGGLYNHSSYPEIHNSMLWGNAAASNPQVYNESSDPTYRYSMVEGETAATLNASGSDSTGNLESADPLFVRDPDPGTDTTWGTTDDDYGDLRLQSSSPVIDVGYNNDLDEMSIGIDLNGDGDTDDTITSDLDGNLRLWDGDSDGTATVDIGAYEFLDCLYNITVTNDADSGAGSLRQAVADICPGSTITFAGDYTIFFDSRITLDSDMTIDGSGQTVTLDGTTTTNIFDVDSGADVTLESLTLQNGSSDIGAINNDGVLTVRNSIFSSNQGQDGPGAILNRDTLTISSSEFISNTSSYYGGAIENSDGTLDVSDSTFSGNTADWSGGAIAGDAGTVTIASSTFSGNTAAEYGGAIANASTLDVSNSTFSSNTAEEYGGAISNASDESGDGTATVSNSTFTDNEAAEDGGAIYSDYESTLDVSDSTFSGNTAEEYGGAIANSDGTIDVSDSTFSGNMADLSGGAIANSDGTATVSDSTFSGNTAAEDGGAIYSDGTAIVSDSTFSGNTAARDGGAIANSDGTATVSDSTFSGNTAARDGGAIYNNNNWYGTLTINSSTFSGNSAGISGGGIYNDGTAHLYNTIIAHSTGGNCSSSDLDTSANNWFDDATCDGISDGDPLLVDPDGADDTVGTADDDLRLQACSAAINAGRNDYLVEANVGSDLNGDGDQDDTITSDRDGNPRIANGTVDIGAYEYQGSLSDYGTLAFSQTTSNGNEGTAPTDTTIATIERTGDSTCPVRTQITLTGGSATAGDDYTDPGFPLFLTIAAGATSQDIVLPILGDTAYEPNDTLSLELHNLNTASLGSSSTTTYTIVNDDAPTVSIDSAPDNPTSRTSAGFTFSGPADASGLSGYECRLDSGEWVACSSSTAQEYSDLSDGEHSFAVRALANSGATGTPAGHSWTVDTIAPTVSIDSASPDLTSSAEASFSFSGDDGSGSGMAGYQCRLDEGAWQTCSSPVSYDKLSEGEHTFSVRATDNTGNTSTLASHTWTVDSTLPAVTFNGDPPAELSNAASISFSFNAADSDGIANLECRLDDGAWEACSSPVNYPDLSDGEHSFSVRATDNAGNTGSASHRWTVDSTPPTLSIDRVPPKLISTNTVTFSFSGDDGSGSGVAGYQCRLDGGAWEACSSPVSYDKLSEGEHTFSVRATDNAGNTSSASHAWTVDSSDPTDPPVEEPYRIYLPLVVRSGGSS